MISALIAGRLQGTPAERLSKPEKPFATAKVRVSTGNGETVWVSVVAFCEAAVSALVALADGDSVALAGTLTGDCL